MLDEYADQFFLNRRALPNNAELACLRGQWHRQLRHVCRQFERHDSVGNKCDAQPSPDKRENCRQVAELESLLRHDAGTTQISFRLLPAPLRPVIADKGISLYTSPVC